MYLFVFVPSLHTLILWHTLVIQAKQKRISLMCLGAWFDAATKGKLKGFLLINIVLL